MTIVAKNQANGKHEAQWASAKSKDRDGMGAMGAGKFGHHKGRVCILGYGKKKGNS